MNTVEITQTTHTAKATQTAQTATADTAAQARQARFGRLPEPIPFSAFVEEVPATPKPGSDYDAERSWLHYSCLALDLGF